MRNLKTYELAMDFYQKCQAVRVNNRHIKDQFERACLSIVLNIAEGYGKPSEKDRRKFFFIAFGSLRETQCLLKLLKQESLLAESDSVAACLYSLAKKPGSIKI